MISGWLLLLAALLLLGSQAQRLVFVLAALVVETIGLGVVAYGYRAVQRGAGGAR
jgi:hypothetical protein